MLGLYDENTGGRVDDTSKEDDEDKFQTPGQKLKKAFENAFIQFEKQNKQKIKESDQQRLMKLLKSEKYREHFIGLKEKAEAKVQEQSATCASKEETNTPKPRISYMQHFQVKRRQMQKEVFIKKMRANQLEKLINGEKGSESTGVKVIKRVSYSCRRR